MTARTEGTNWTAWPASSPDEQRAALYAGALLSGPSTSSSQALVALAWRLLEAELGVAPRAAVLHLSSSELFARLGRVRRALYLSPDAHALLFSLLREHGFDPRAFAFDPPRLRVVHPDGDREAAARAVYAVHRDTWYGHPRALLTWWIPLHDVPATQTFSTWPAYFSARVDNDSSTFDYDDWVARGWSLKIGWQDPAAGLSARYPAFLGERSALGDGVGFAATQAENRVFSGTHLHGTRVHTGPLTRFSLDFRLVHLGDHDAGRGAPDVDNDSLGSALRDYLRADSTGFGSGA
jgi:hypothetical protein